MNLYSMVFMLLLILFSFYGCENNDKISSSNATSTKHKITVGAILPMTGPAAQYGKWVRQGMEIGKEEIKKKYPNIDLKVSYEDSQGVTKNAISIFQKFGVQDINVVFVLTSGETLAIAPLSEKNNIVIFTGTLIPGITQYSQLLIRNSVNMAQEVKVMAEYLTLKKTKPNVAIIYVNNEVGNFSKDKFIQLYEKHGGKITGAEAYEPGTTDFRAHLTKLAEAKPDILYLLSYGEWGTIAKQARELGLELQFAGATPIEDKKAVAIAGSAAEGTIYTKAAYEPDSTDPEIKSFQEKYKQKYNETADVYAATFRDNLILIANAASQGKTSGKELVNFIINLKTFNGASGFTQFTKDRDVEKPVAIYEIRQGTFHSVER